MDSRKKNKPFLLLSNTTGPSTAWHCSLCLQKYWGSQRRKMEWCLWRQEALYLDDLPALVLPLRKVRVPDTPHARRTVEKDRYTYVHTLVLPLVALRHCTTFLASLKWGKWYLPCKDINIIVVVQLLSCVLLFATPWTAARQISLSFTISLSLLKLMSIELVMSSNHLILYHPLLLLPSIFSSIRVFSSESALHIRWPEYWSFRFTISSSNEYSGLISFRIYWFDLLPV